MEWPAGQARKKAGMAVGPAERKRGRMEGRTVGELGWAPVRTVAWSGRTGGWMCHAHHPVCTVTVLFPTQGGLALRGAGLVFRSWVSSHVDPGELRPTRPAHGWPVCRCREPRLSSRLADEDLLCARHQAAGPDEWSAWWEGDQARREGRQRWGPWGRAAGPAWGSGRTPGGMREETTGAHLAGPFEEE